MLRGSDKTKFENASLKRAVFTEELHLAHEIAQHFYLITTQFGHKFRGARHCPEEERLCDVLRADANVDALFHFQRRFGYGAP